MPEDKLNSQSRPMVVMIWLLIGALLFIPAQALYAQLREFRLEYVVSSEKNFGFVIYSLVAITIWAIGWRSINNNHAIYAQRLDNRKEALGKMPILLRGGLGLFLLLLPTTLMLAQWVGPDLFRGLGGFLLLLTSSFTAALILRPSLAFFDWLFEAFILFAAAAVIFMVANNFLLISPYPFSLGWSEGNRIWDYSVLFGSDRYLTPDNQPIDVFINLSRQFIWGLPFLFSGTNIVHFRTWDAVVKTLPALFFAVYLITAGLNNNDLKWREVLAFGLWGFLFISQGPIFPQLIVPAIFTVLGLRAKNLWAGSAWIAAAGYIAVVGRFSWAYAPGLWSGMFALLQTENPSFSKEKRAALLRPIILAASGYVGGQILASLIPISSLTRVSQSGLALFSNVTDQPAFGQALLWRRWFPNPTFGPGILLALFFVSVPVLVLLVWVYRRGHWRPNWLQITTFSLVLLAFLGVGLVASVKIGGGGDLHNLDMFIVGMLFLAATAWPAILKLLEESKPFFFRLSLIYFLLATPVIYLLNLRIIEPISLPTDQEIISALVAIQITTDAAASEGDILFMDQRQLLTFGFVQNIVLIDEYEKKYVMDKALSGDQQYFDQFHQDLAAHRFSLIVSEKLFLKTEDGSSPFSEENDAWVNWVSMPLLTYYQPLATLNSVGVLLLVPRN